ncbi:hypothetical protein HMPREF0554_2280 [Pseudoleptotrichia goodfellowii F0264]|uniref:Uncharacterized protein n=1 Tax=Pseudoleptotrichia goodfellowii F0264 TaxID=596323 RepID=D0GPP5_9FUSO|nr:hypothetical protein HMPREF0554_2280 [Pseudoleptotrichia goodfellowii F0264]
MLEMGNVFGKIDSGLFNIPKFLNLKNTKYCDIFKKRNNI